MSFSIKQWRLSKQHLTVKENSWFGLINPVFNGS